jgi:hypothetical protein
MRPDLSDVLSGVQRLLLSEIVPALGAQPYAQEQATYATLLLEYVKNAWPRQHLELAVEHADLRDTLQRLGAALVAAGNESASALGTKIAAALDAERVAAAEVAVDALMERDRALRGLLGEAIRTLGDGSALGGRAALAIVDAFLARDAERRDAARLALGVNW